MPSPFPGMDPYLESPNWSDFHATFIPCWRRAINGVLPRGYRAHIDTSTKLIQIDTAELKQLFPDVAVVYEKGRTKPEPLGGAVATLEPVIRTLPRYEEVKERWIEVTHETDNTLVAMLELLSPWNKAPGAGRGEYLAKRSKIIRQTVHLIGVDLLLNGVRLPVQEPLPPGDYFALVSRSDRRPQCEVYSWNLPDRLPKVPLPLLPGDADVLVDLAEAFAATYDMGGYADDIKYEKPPRSKIPEIHREWVLELAKSASSR